MNSFSERRRLVNASHKEGSTTLSIRNNENEDMRFAEVEKGCPRQN